MEIDKIKEEFKQEFSITVTPQNEQEHVKKFLLEKFWEYTILDNIADWWINKFSQHNEEIEKIARASYLSMLDQKMTMFKSEFIKKIEETIQIERVKLDSCRNDKVNWSYHQGKIHQMQDLLTLIKNSK